LHVKDLEQRVNETRALAKQEGDPRITDMVLSQIQEVLVDALIAIANDEAEPNAQELANAALEVTNISPPNPAPWEDMTLDDR
jgi:hypothetical protein